MDKFDIIGEKMIKDINEKSNKIIGEAIKDNEKEAIFKIFLIGATLTRETSRLMLEPIDCILNRIKKDGKEGEIDLETIELLHKVLAISDDSLQIIGNKYINFKLTKEEINNEISTKD